MFIKWSCGCIGLDIQNPNKAWLIIEACDRSDEGIELSWRGEKIFAGKTFEPLDCVKCADLIHEMACLIGEGHRMRRVANDLRAVILNNR